MTFNEYFFKANTCLPYREAIISVSFEGCVLCFLAEPSEAIQRKISHQTGIFAANSIPTKYIYVTLQYVCGIVRSLVVLLLYVCTDWYVCLLGQLRWTTSPVLAIGADLKRENY